MNCMMSDDWKVRCILRSMRERDAGFDPGMYASALYLIPAVKDWPSLQRLVRAVASVLAPSDTGPQFPYKAMGAKRIVWEVSRDGETGSIISLGIWPCDVSDLQLASQGLGSVLAYSPLSVNQMLSLDVGCIIIP